MSAVEPVCTPEDLADEPVEKEIRSEFADTVSAAVFLHDAQDIRAGFQDFIKFGFTQRPDRAESPREEFAVTAVRPEDDVVAIERECHADGRRLLSGGEMRRAGVAVFDPVVVFDRADAVDHSLDFADVPHVEVDFLQFLRRKRLPFLLE